MLRLFGLSREDTPLPQDRLQVKHLVSGRAVLQSQSGIPFSSDSLAYEPVQRLFAVGTSDGRIKVIGRDGVERGLYSSGSQQEEGEIGELHGSSNGTRQLLFLANRGGILRLNKAGLLELFSVDPADSSSSDDPCQPLASLALPEDKVCCVAALQQEPLLLLGCSSGAIKVAGLVNASGELVLEARQVRGLKLLPYSIAPWKLDATGPVSSLVVQSNLPYQHLLVVHEGSGAAVWDLRAQVLVARVNHGIGEGSNRGGSRPAGALNHTSGPITAADWLQGSSKGDFATGHDSGDVNIWSLSDGSSGSWQRVVAGQLQQQVQPQLVAQLRVALPGGRGSSSDIRSRSCSPMSSNAGDGHRLFSAVRSMQYVSGRAEGLLVFGGEEEGKPDGLVLLPLPEPKLSTGIEDPTTQEQQQAAIAAAAQRLPWMGSIVGHALVPMQGAITGNEDPSSVLVLVEGGHVVLHDLTAYAAAAAAASSPSSPTAAGRAANLAVQQQRPSVPCLLLEQRLQGQPLVTAARLRILPIDRVPLQGLQGACMISLQDWSNSSSPAAAGAGAASMTTAAGNACNWVIAGGQQARCQYDSSSSSSGSYASVYCTGHADGGVRLWAMHTESPQLLGRAPSTAAMAKLKERGMGRAAPVSTLEFAWEQGLLVSGHEGGEVRVYQFSEGPKRIDCVIFESVGTCTNNEILSVEEPAGFQLRLMSHLHSSNIVSSTYLPQFKLVAVSDSSGSVSILDLARAAVPWFQSPWSNQPVVSLAIGYVSLPGPKERNPALAQAAGAASGKAGPAAMGPAGAVRAVVAVAADSQVAVLDAATGFFLSRYNTVVPRHPSPALHVELLDESGAPTWMSRDVHDLIQLSLSQQLSNSRTLSNSSNRPAADSSSTVAPGGGYSSMRASQQQQQQQQVKDKEEEHTEEDEADVDALLARAAAQVEAESRRKGKKGSNPSSPTRVGQNGRVSMPPGAASMNDIYQRISAGGGTTSSSLNTAPLTTRPTINRLSSINRLASSNRTSSAPIVLSEPVAHYALVATRHYLRVYALSHALAGFRDSSRKVVLPGALQFASSFTAAGAPALECLIEQDGEVHLQVYTLPNLELVRDMPLSSLLGWTFSWDCRHTEAAGTGMSAAAAAAGIGVAAAMTRLAAACAATRHGHLALLGPGSELIRLALAAGAAGVPDPPVAVYDWDMATAAHAASTAAARQQMRSWEADAAAGKLRSGGAAADDDSDEDLVDEATDAFEEDGGLGEGLGGGGKFKGFMSQLGTDIKRAGSGVPMLFQKALDETHKGLKKVANAIDSKPAKQVTPEYPHPPLITLFAGIIISSKSIAVAVASASAARNQGPGSPLSPASVEAAVDGVCGGGGRSKSPFRFTSPLQRGGVSPLRGASAGVPSSPPAGVFDRSATPPRPASRPASAAAGISANAGRGGLPAASNRGRLTASADVDDFANFIETPDFGRAPSPPGSKSISFSHSNSSHSNSRGSSFSSFSRPSPHELGLAGAQVPVGGGVYRQQSMAAAYANATAHRSTGVSGGGAGGPGVGGGVYRQQSVAAAFAGGGSSSSSNRPSGGPGLGPAIGGGVYRQQSVAAAFVGSGGGAGGGAMGGGGGGLVRQQSLTANFASSQAAASGAKLRSADEIRQAYGRGAAQKSNELRGVMEETRAALGERGQRLSQLQEQTADLAESAAGFAELAKQLADKERAKTKWFG